MFRRIAIAAVVLVCAQAMRAAGPETPWEITTQTARLAIVGQVLSDGVVQPDNSAAGRMSAPEYLYEVKVVRTIKSEEAASKPASKPAAEKAQTIKVLVQGVGPMPMIGPSPIKIAKGKSYVMMLRAGREQGSFYLNPLPSMCSEATDENIKRAENAADPAKWAWGKAVGGIQMILLTPEVIQCFAQPVVPVLPAGQEMTLNLQIEAAVALRNNSDKPIAINLFDLDGYMSVQAVDANGKITPCFLYPPRGPVAGGFAEKDAVTLQPGQMRFIQPMGPAGGPTFNLPLSLTFGKWKIKASYGSKRDAKVAGLPLWKGAVEAPQRELSVEQATMPGRLIPQ